MLVNTNKDVSDEVVMQVLKAMHDNKKQLVATFPALRGFNPDQMYMPVPGMEYHPAAIKYYKELKQTGS